MDLLFIVLSLLNAMTIPLGVGASTIAILNFFTAIHDGTIDQKEREFMSVTYIVLRVAMVIILVTEISIILIDYVQHDAFVLTSFMLSQLLLIALLFINAILMTARVMPSTFGPAIQATSWYGLGFTSALVPLSLHEFSLYTFVVVFVLCLFVVTLLINWRMVHVKKLLKAAPKTTA